MRRLQNVMTTPVDQLALGLCIGSPEQENKALTLAIQDINDAVGEPFPAFALVRAWPALFHGQHGIQQQHAALRPWNEATVIRARNSEVALDFRKDVDQRWRRRHTGQYGKTQAVRLTGAVVRILAEDHDFHLVERRAVERVEDARPRRIDALARMFFGKQELAQREHLRPLEMVAHARFPRSEE